MKWFQLLLVLSMANLLIACGSKNETAVANTVSTNSPSSPDGNSTQAQPATTYTKEEITTMLYRKMLTQTSSSLSCLNTDMNLRAASAYMDVETTCDNMSSGQLDIHNKAVIEYENQMYLELDMGSYNMYYKILNVSATYIKLSYTDSEKTVTQEFRMESL